ncbi:flavodoxin family protein [Acetobacterium sp.]|jgi:NAD(P)H-dependent FMN reductase|uniref:flavodoxin family protein n=1 Tax=Acetobacterium sp. TaxID=1872094 RepID=UPI000CA84A1F|nr:flavodoxin family protein [Acetobacterium sp.]MDO9492109.1 flavodoxin family protein [Acetobacterium sp.]PKM74632.1 MAG: flavodoxin family protein [Firmicutes bacterium HGW-Firmicutes-17]
MNILFLNASPRLNGYTAGTMKCIKNALDSEHIVQWININNLNVKPCQGCLQCRPDKSCILPQDDGHRIAKLIRYADALVIGSPTYFGNVTGPFRTLIDRSLTALEEISSSGLEMPRPLHIGQRAAIVTACNSPSPLSELPNQAAGALSAMQTTLDAGGYDIVGSIIVDAAAGLVGIPQNIENLAKQIAVALQASPASL